MSSITMYTLKYGSDDERRNMGESDIYGSFDDLDNAKLYARKLVDNGIAVCAEVIAHENDEEELLFGCDNENEW